MTSGHSISRIFSYFICAVLTTFLSGYYFFPADKIKTYCEKSVEYLAPGSVCRIGKVELLLPMRVSFENIQIQGDGPGNSSMFVMDRLVISPVLLNFWQKISLKGELYSGEFQAEFRHNYQGKKFELADIRIENVDVAEVRKNIDLLQRKVTGRIGFAGNYKARFDLPLDGIGQGTVTLTLGSMELLRPVLSLTKLNFEKFSSAVKCETAKCRFSQGELLGTEVGASFSGELNLKAPFMTSTLQFNGSLDPQETFFKTRPEGDKMVRQLLYINKTDILPFTVGGTLNWPTFRFSM